MLRLLRIVVFFALVVLLTEAVIAVAAGTTGWLEKAVILAAAAGVVIALPRLRRLGARQPALPAFPPHAGSSSRGARRRSARPPA